MADKVVVYHYPKCKKSRAGLEFVKELGLNTEVINYVDQGIAEDELRQLLSKLKLSAFEMVRQQEEYYKETLRDREFSEDEWIKILSENPRLLRRPVVVYNEDAVVADPPQNANKLLTAYIK